MTDHRSFIILDKLFMAIIVDKDKKRRDIAIACTELLLEKGLKNLTVEKKKKTAGIGKGTVYEYFSKKEDVVYEIIRNLMAEHQQDIASRTDSNTSTRQKVFYLMDFLLQEDKDYSKHLETYKEFVSITLSDSNADEMHQFNAECNSFMKSMLTDIINEGIEKNEIIPESKNLIGGIMISESGAMLRAWLTNTDTKKEFKNYINTLFNLIEIKK